MKGFKDWFTEKHGFWPALPRENTANVLARLCDAVAEFVDEAVSRGDYADVVDLPSIETRRIYHDGPLFSEYRRERFLNNAHTNGKSFQFDGHRWKYQHTSFDDRGEYDIIFRFADPVPDAKVDEPRVTAPATLRYTNYRGETSERLITPLRTWFGSTDWHPQYQWFLEAFDHEKQAKRDFALADFGARAPAVKLELIRTVSETPVSSHGGPAAGISWELKLNGVLIEREYHRVHWSDRECSLLKPIESMKLKHDDLKAALGCTTRDPLETAGLVK